MFSETMLILTAGVCLFVGAVIGYIIAAGAAPSGSGRRTLENRLKSTEQQLEDYKTEVTHHFERTAELVNNLTESYKDVHEHLAKGAGTLADPNLGKQFLSNADKAWLPNDEQPSDLIDENTNIEPPKDWAPGKGTLREDFGLDKKTPPQPAPEPPNRPV